MVMGSALWEEARDYCIGKQKKRKQKKKQQQQQQASSTATVKASNNKPEQEFVGPDTSSLTAFFYSFISTSEPVRPGHDHDHNDEDDDDEEQTTVDGSDTEDDKSTVSSSGSKLMPIRDESEQQPQEKSFMGEPGGLEDIGKVDMPSTGATTGPSTSASASANASASAVVVDDFDADEWQLVSEKDLMSSRVFSTDPPPTQVVEGKSAVSLTAVKQVQQQQLPLQLPALSEQSSLLTESLRSTIYNNLPTLIKGRQWVLLYSTMRHGISLRTLYRKSNLISGPSLLVAGDRLGAIFGGLISSPLKPTPKKKYQGTSESFVYTNVAGTPKVFRSTGCNRYFVLCTNDSLSFGGGGHFALHIDSELLYGSSAECETYGNTGLATTEDFVLKDVELWGFAHTSRYVPRHAAYTEPEYVPGIYTW